MTPRKTESEDVVPLLRDVVASPTAFDAAGHAYLVGAAQWFAPGPLRKGVRRGRRGVCFLNAVLASNAGLRYCEGLAEHADLPGRWFHHAWCATPQRLVQDPTWMPVGTRYWGVAVDLETFRDPDRPTGLDPLQHGLLPLLFGREAAS
jgi:hypothetical protein